MALTPIGTTQPEGETTQQPRRRRRLVRVAIAVLLVAVLAFVYAMATSAMERAPDTVAISVFDYHHGTQRPQDGGPIYARTVHDPRLAQRAQVLLHRAQAFAWPNPAVNCPMNAPREAKAWYFTFSWHTIPVEWIRLDIESTEFSCLPEHITTLRGPALEYHSWPLPKDWHELATLTRMPEA